MKQLVATLIADDRTGLVEQVAEVVNAHGGNWLESRMVRLAGKFTGLLNLEVPIGNVAGLEQALGELGGQGIRVLIEDAGAAGTHSPTATWRVDVIGQDTPGIVKQISYLLASKNVNVEEMRSQRDHASMSGEMMFQATYDISLPNDLSADDLQTTLEAVSMDLNVEISALT